MACWIELESKKVVDSGTLVSGRYADAEGINNFYTLTSGCTHYAFRTTYMTVYDDSKLNEYTVLVEIVNNGLSVIDEEGNSYVVDSAYK